MFDKETKKQAGLTERGMSTNGRGIPIGTLCDITEGFERDTVQRLLDTAFGQLGTEQSLLELKASFQ